VLLTDTVGLTEVIKMIEIMTQKVLTGYSKNSVVIYSLITLILLQTSFCLEQVVSNLYEFLSSAEHK